MGAVKRALKLIRRRPWEQCDRYEMEALWKSDRYHKHSLSLPRHHWQNVTQGSIKHKWHQQGKVGGATKYRFAAIKRGGGRQSRDGRKEKRGGGGKDK